MLWSILRNKQIDGVKFRRQHPLGKYIVDFVSLENKLIIEVDGGQHNEEEIKEKDAQRTKWLEEDGYQILRFWNNEVFQNTDGVFLRIKEALENSLSLR